MWSRRKLDGLIGMWFPNEQIEVLFCKLWNLGGPEIGNGTCATGPVKEIFIVASGWMTNLLNSRETGKPGAAVALLNENRHCYTCLENIVVESIPSRF
jgi:hypothetical protein